MNESLHPTLAQEAVYPQSRTLTEKVVRSDKLRSLHLSPGETSRAVIASHADDPTGARPAAERFAGTVDELRLLAEAEVELEVLGRYEMDQRPARLTDAGVRYRKPHTARHTFATQWRRRGLGVDEIQILLGHASIRTTADTYVHTQIEDVAARMQELMA